jgi:G-patch domain
MSLYDDIPQPRETRHKSSSVAVESGNAVSLTRIVAPVAPPRIIQSTNAQSVQPKVAMPKRIEVSSAQWGSDKTHGTDSGSCQLYPTSDHITEARHAIFEAIPSSCEDYDPMTPNEYSRIKRALDAREVLLHGRRTPSEKSHCLAHSDNVVLYHKDPSFETWSPGDNSEASNPCARHSPKASDFILPPISEPAINPMVSGMMARMGWTVGTGLGISKQGRTEPLCTVGYDGRGGLGKAVPVVHFSEKSERKVKTHVGDQARNIAGRRRRSTSRVLLLQLPSSLAIVDLESKFREICAPYGSVERIIVRSEQEPRFAGDDLADYKNGHCIRTYVMFSQSEAASGALLGLDGSQIMGQTLRTSRYPEALFTSMKSEVERCREDSDVPFDVESM